jgi:hypothetical protein
MEHSTEVEEDRAALRELERQVTKNVPPGPVRDEVLKRISEALADLTPGRRTALRVALAKSPETRRMLRILAEPSRHELQSPTRGAWLAGGLDVPANVWARLDRGQAR